MILSYVGQLWTTVEYHNTLMMNTEAGPKCHNKRGPVHRAFRDGHQSITISALHTSSTMKIHASRMYPHF